MARFSRRNVFLRSLVRTAYFPDELPPVLTTSSFAAFCHKNYTAVTSDLKRLLRLPTKFDTFTVPRTGGMGRRNLALVHPLGQLSVSILLTLHRSTIRSIIDKNGLSLYRTTEDPKSDRAFSGLDFRSWENKKSSIYSEYRYILTADISRFFYTIYTHSISWSVLGKDKTKIYLADPKKKSKLLSHWSSRLDTALQSCQSRETFGLPVGPDTSRIVAEILMSGVESDIQVRSLFAKGLAIRLLDDFVVGFDDLSTASSALVALRRALWAYNLQLNEEKTKILPSSKLFKEKWKLEFDEISVDSDIIERQRDKISNLIDRALSACDESASSTPASWACAKLNRTQILEENFPWTLDCIFRLSRDVPYCTSQVAVFVINNQETIRKLSLIDRVRRWIKSKLRDHGKSSHDFEIAWSLTVAAALRIKLTDDDFGQFDQLPSSVVFTIIGLLNERKLLGFPLSKWKWRAEFKRGGIYGENWLPLYESVRRKWTSDKSLVSLVNADPILAQMLADKVTFLNDDFLEVSSINLTRRSFKRGAGVTASTGGTNVTEAESEDADIEWYP